MAAESSITLNVMDFSMSPGPRYIDQGNDSGEAFYLEKLKDNFQKALHDHVTLIVNLDGVDGYASSFLDEAFGNLVFDFGASLTLANLHIISDEEPEWKEMILSDTLKNWEKRRNDNKPPRRSSTE